MHERRAKLLALLFAVLVAGAFVYIALSYTDMRSREIARQRAEEAAGRRALVAAKAQAKLAEERYVPPAPIKYPFF